jgi:hypothetical protein
MQKEKQNRKQPDVIINVDGHCSPAAQTNYKKYSTCLSPDDLTVIADRYNKVSDEKISKKYLKQPKKLYKKLLDLTKCDQGNDACLINQPLIKQSDIIQRLSKRFRPKMRASWLANEREWLNTLDILTVMKQYEEKYEDFEFLGVFPVDFALKYNSSDICISKKMCTFTVAEFLAKKVKKQFGMVINLDKHDGPGSHWVALYVNLNFDKRQCGAVYFDSGGLQPPKEVKLFLKDLQTEINLIGFPDQFKFYYNQTPYQKQNTECGMFSMIFIISCLEHQYKQFKELKEYFNTLNLHDDLVFNHRRHLYTDPTMPITNSSLSSFGDNF